MNITESSSNYDHLDQMSIGDLLHNINNEDKTVPFAIEKAIPAIEKLILAVTERMKGGGRLFYIGAGTSGRLGIVDASECPPTFGVPYDMVVGIIAGGDGAIRKAVEFAEDDEEQAWKDLSAFNIKPSDCVVGIAASGRTPYVIGGLTKCNSNGILTGSISCNPGSAVSKVAEFPIEVIVGPEFISGSTRMKAGTAQKLVLNMISTSLMIRLGRVKGNKMVDMQLSNHKLVNRGIEMLQGELNITKEEATQLINTYGNVRKAIDSFKK